MNKEQDNSTVTMQHTYTHTHSTTQTIQAVIWVDSILPGPMKQNDHPEVQLAMLHCHDS